MDLRVYQTEAGDQPFWKWPDSLRDRQARARIQTRMDRMMTGNFGDAKPVGGGVMEVRVDWGPGCRVYFAPIGQVVVLLLCAGDKKTQQKDIEHAKAYLEDYKARG